MPVPVVARGIDPYVVSRPAAFQARRRGIDRALVASVLAAPQQQLTMRPGRVVLQSQASFGISERRYLVRVVVDVDRTPAEVVTIYRTSKVSKYWKKEP